MIRKKVVRKVPKKNKFAGKGTGMFETVNGLITKEIPENQLCINGDCTHVASIHNHAGCNQQGCLCLDFK